MIIGAVVAAVLWIIYTVWIFLSLRPWERLSPSGLVTTLLFLEVCGVTTGAIVNLLRGTL